MMHKQLDCIVLTFGAAGSGRLIMHDPTCTSQLRLKKICNWAGRLKSILLLLLGATFKSLPSHAQIYFSPSSVLFSSTIFFSLSVTLSFGSPLVMGSFTFSSLLETMDTKITFLQRSGKRKGRTDQPSAPRLSRKRDLFLAFFIVSLPLLVISILLLSFIFLSDREIPASYASIPELPFFEYPPLDAFYTRKDTGDFLLLGSWASNVAEMVVAPFMVLFSYTLAREILQRSKNGHEDSDSRPPLLREIMRGTHVGVWDWIAQRTNKKPRHALGKEPLLRVVDIAGLGLSTAILLT